MRTDICAREDEDTIDALLAALTAVGARPADADFDGTDLGVGRHRFVAADGQQLTVFVDAWGVDLEGSDELVRRVTEHLED